MKYILLLLIQVCGLNVFAQVAIPRNYPVSWNSNLLTNAFCGGMNAPQFSEGDLNQDGKKDLMVFDRIGGVVSIYLWENDKYQYHPEYSRYFPKTENFMLLRDFNQDGIPDIFCFPPELGAVGIAVYEGSWMNNHIQFKRRKFPTGAYDVIQYPVTTGTTGIFVALVDLPAIEDLDGDGDLDVLSFSSNGGYIEMYRNTSAELGFSLDSLKYVSAESCWGGIYESGISNKIFLSGSNDSCAYSPGFMDPQVRHVGGSIASTDVDNNGLMDVIIGDISYANLTLGLNNGTAKHAYVTEVDSIYPHYDIPVKIPFFPAPYILDYNHDGARDLIAAVNNENVAEDVEVAHAYLNISNAGQVLNLKLDQTNFLGTNMLDLGTHAAPLLVDENQDGLLDIIVGTNGRFTTSNFTLSRNPRLVLLRNTGTISNPQFTLVDNDYLGFLKDTIMELAPTAGDIDQDGDLDLLIGELDGKLYYFQNTAGAGKPFQFAQRVYPYMGIGIGTYSAPAMYDVNQDGLMDLFVGERNGNVNYFQNSGTIGNPFFSSNNTFPNTDKFGKIDTRKPGYYGHSVPLPLQVGNQKYLLCGSRSGDIYQYILNSADYINPFTIKDTSLADIYSGILSHPTIGDLNQDGSMEIIVGNERGGIQAFQLDFSSSLSNFSSNTPWNISPNPFQDILNIHSNETFNDISWELKNIQTQNVLRGTVQNASIPLPNLTSGFYILTLRSGIRIQHFKVLKVSN